jgi:class 3 adenylate cyclase
MCTSASGTMKGASQPPRRCAHGILAVFSHGRAKHQTAFPKQACGWDRLESKRTNFNVPMRVRAGIATSAALVALKIEAVRA